MIDIRHWTAKRAGKALIWRKQVILPSKIIGKNAAPATQICGFLNWMSHPLHGWTDSWLRLIDFAAAHHKCAVIE
jgi:hypothetical protein